MITEKRRPTEWARAMIKIHPTVEAFPMEDVLAICQPPDLLSAAEVVEANGTAFSLIAAGDADEGEELAEEDGGEGRRVWDVWRRRRRVVFEFVEGDRFGFEEIGWEAKVVEEGKEEFLHDG